MSRGVIFDMDGVLVMTEEAHWRSWKAVAEGRGVRLSHETFLSCFGRVNTDCVRVIFGEGIPPGEAARIAEAKEIAFREIIHGRVPLAFGVLELLEALRGLGFSMAVGSSAPRENIELVLAGGGIGQYFDASVDGAQVLRGKPAPDVFLLAAERLGLSPERCIVIEDAPPGIVAARAAGMTAVGVATTRPARELWEAGAHRVFNDVAAVAPAELDGMIT